MLHVILLILKILGIIILSIIGLVMLVILVCLFVPVVYHIKGDKHEQTIKGSGRVTWLFVTMSAKINNEDKKLKTKIRVFGIPIEIFLKVGRVFGGVWKNITKFLGKITSFFKRKKEVIVEKKAVKTSQSTKDIVEQTEIEKGKLEDSEEASAVEREEITKSNDSEKVSVVEREETTKKNDDEKEASRLKTMFLKIWYFPKWLSERVRKIYLTIKEFCGKINRWKQFLTGETFKKALRFVLKRGNVLRKHTLPRKIKGNVIYGFDDPSLTGQTLALASMISPLYKGRFKVVPMFDEQILEGDIYMRGHVFGFILLRIAWSVYRNKDVKEVIHYFSQKEA